RVLARHPNWLLHDTRTKFARKNKRNSLGEIGGKMINAQDQRRLKMPISARFSPPHSYLELFLHGNQRRTRVANGTTSEELAYLQLAHGPRDLYPQKFCKN